jgi:hypothetical protein
MAFIPGSCAFVVDESMAKIRQKTQEVVDDYVTEADKWASDQEKYLEDLQKYLNGVIKVEPESPGPPPEVPSVDEYPSSADYNKAFGDGFLKFVCDNVVVQFAWDGTGTDTSSGSTVSDPSFPTGYFLVSGASGGGTLEGPGKNDPSMLNTFLNNLSLLVSDLEVTLPAVSGVTYFDPVTVKFKAGAKLSANPSKYADGDNPSYEGILTGVCADLIDSLKKNFPSDTGCVNYVTALLANVPGGFSGTAAMSSISFPNSILEEGDEGDGDL